MNRVVLKTIAVCAAAGFLCACSRENAYVKPPVPVRVVKLMSQSGGQRLTYSANIMPLSQVFLAFKNGGYIDSMLYVNGAVVQAGDAVKSGTVLAGLRKADFTQRFNMAQGSVAEAEAMNKKASADFARAEKLFNAASLTRPEYDAARAQLEVTQAKLSSARAMLAEAGIAMNDADLKSPFDAVVLKRLKETGDMVGPGMPVFVLADVSRVKAVFGVPGEVADTLKVGRTVSVSLDAMPGKIFSGRISGISASADAASRVFDVEVTLPNPARMLKPGLIASIELSGKSAAKGVMVLPISAVVRPMGGGYGVYAVVNKNGTTTAELKSVVPGDFYENNIEIKSGVLPEDLVIVDGTPELTPGCEVNIISGAD